MNYQWIDQYLLEKSGIVKDYKEEWNWHRYLLNKKMVAAICKDKENKDIITIKCEPLFGEQLRSQYEDIVEGYYMNKVHWNSVYLDGNVPNDLVKAMIDQSYDLIFSDLSKKMQKEILDSDKRED